MDPPAMGVRFLLFSAARDGKVNKLQRCLMENPYAVVRTAVESKTNGATPLVMAAKNGHLNAVMFLVNQLNADIEQVGNVQFDGETIEGAPPLWCASAAGHLDVVKFLVENKARVNSTTKTKSTPLRAACYDGHLEIVRYLIEHEADVEIANRHGHTCLMIACYKGHLNIAKFLLRFGADVNRKSVKGNTALHDCAESGSLEIMKLLLDHEAKMEEDSYGVTPLIAAALTGHSQVVELILAAECSGSRERVNALELLGATFVDKKRDMMGALEYWRRAIRDREKFGIRFNRRRNSSIASAISQAYYADKKRSDGTINPCRGNGQEAKHRPWKEVETEEELEELFSDPDDMRMQALAVRERILGPAHPDTSYYIRYRGAVYADTGNYDKCIQLWMYALNMQQEVLDTLNPMIQSSLLSFAELFSYMMSKSFDKVTFPDVFAVFQRAVRQLQYSSVPIQKYVVVPATMVEEEYTEDSSSLCETPTSLGSSSSSTVCSAEESNYHRTLVIVLHFVGLMCRLLPFMSTEEEFTLKKAVYKLMKFAPRGRNGLTPLHLSCMTDSSYPSLRFPLCEFPMVEMVKLLLEVGSSPNDLDHDLCTPLHAVATMLYNGNVSLSAAASNVNASNNNNPATSSPIIMAACRTVVDLLLEHGAHIDIRNLKGETPLELLNRASASNKTAVRSENANENVLPAFESLNELRPLKFMSLQCLAAQALVKHKVPIAGCISKDLEKFVRIH